MRVTKKVENYIREQVKAKIMPKYEAEKAELEYMLGLNDSVTDLLVAQQKANISLQYTVAIKNAVTQAYQEIMAIQF